MKHALIDYAQNKKFSIQYIYDGSSMKSSLKFEMEFPSEEDAEEFCFFEQSRLNAAGSDVSVVLQPMTRKI